MGTELLWWGLSLLAVVTVYWAAVWWWLPKMFGDREREDEPPVSDEKGTPPTPGPL